MYASAVQLLARYSADEIAQRADASIPPLVYGELLTKAAMGADLSDYSAEEQAAAGAAPVQGHAADGGQPPAAAPGHCLPGREQHP
ncbi:hypothetical protein [Pseudomonas anguilliseptica]|uniref:hypothetical protein n=1 Tax=Pseudomonas anguilliseptica TaxID=53406 RepID=UPI001114EE47|nr:hypothetical protein [Pseudomonas anguilliseptica]